MLVWAIILVIIAGGWRILGMRRQSSLKARTVKRLNQRRQRQQIHRLAKETAAKEKPSDEDIEGPDKTD